MNTLGPVDFKPESLADVVYSAIREAIVSKQLLPGERVTEAGLATRLHVSKTPVREAMLRLQEVGLIEADENAREPGDPTLGGRVRARVRAARGA